MMIRRSFLMVVAMLLLVPFPSGADEEMTETVLPNGMRVVLRPVRATR